MLGCEVFYLSKFLVFSVDCEVIFVCNIIDLSNLSFHISFVFFFGTSMCYSRLPFLFNFLCASNSLILYCFCITLRQWWCVSF